MHGCQHTFIELATSVLPGYMAELRKRMQTPTPLDRFTVRGMGRVSMMGLYNLERDPTGCYVFLDGGRPIYVGISQHVLERIMQHVRSGNHLSASLAYRIAVHRSPHNKTAAVAMQDPIFRREFETAQAYLRSLGVAFIEITNPLVLHVFEVYCAMELSTGLDSGGWNTFETH